MASRSRIPSKRAVPRYLRWLLTLVLVVGVIYLGKAVLVPLALAMLVTFVLTPPVMAVQRRGAGRVPAVLLVVSVTLLLAVVVGWGAGSQVAKLARDLPKHRDEIQAKIARLQGTGSGPIARLIETFRGPPKQTEGTGSTQKDIVVVRQEEPSALDRMSTVVSAVFEPAADAGLVLILVVFMLIRREDLRNRLIGLLGHGRLTGTTRVLVESAHRVSRFLLMQLAVNSAFGIVIGIAMLLIGVPYWFLWGFLAVVLRFVPYLGTWLAAALPTVLSFAISPGWMQPLLVLASFIVLDLMTANVAEPLLFGHSTGVSPVALLIAAVFWTWVWGPIGLVLSTPMTVCMVVLGQHAPRLRFLSLLLGDQPALAPHAAYYQRLLADDPAEAAAVVRSFAKRTGIELVPDEVMIPAIRLARRDRIRAGLSAEDEKFIFDTTEGVLRALPSPLGMPADGLATAGPAAIGLPLIVGCPAHHRAEELAIAMLTLALRDTPCRVEPMTTRTLPAELEAKIEREQAALLFIPVIPPGGLPQCRYLCRRLRRKFPDLPIVVGYFGKVRQFDKLLIKLRAAGASYVNTSIAQVRAQVLSMLAAQAVAAPGRAGAPAPPAAPAPHPIVT
jgi:predicted PurR-regulated permease PerM